MKKRAVIQKERKKRIEILLETESKKYAHFLINLRSECVRNILKIFRRKSKIHLI